MSCAEIIRDIQRNHTTAVGDLASGVRLHSKLGLSRTEEFLFNDGDTVRLVRAFSRATVTSRTAIDAAVVDRRPLVQAMFRLIVWRKAFDDD